MTDFGISVGAKDGSRVAVVLASNCCQVRISRGVHGTELSDLIPTLVRERHFIAIQVETDRSPCGVIGHSLLASRIGCLLQ